MRLILQVIGDDGIIIAVLVSDPYEGIHPHVGGHFRTVRHDGHGIGAACIGMIVPEIVVVAGVVCRRAVNIENDLQAIGLALLHNDIKDGHAVLELTRCIAEIGVDGVGGVIVRLHAGYGIGGAVHPGIDQLCGNRDTQYIDTVVSDAGQCIIHIDAPEIVYAVFAAVEAEPVRTGQPDLVAVLIVQTAADCMQPVIIAVIGCPCVQCDRTGSTGTDRQCSDERSQFVP